MREFVKDDKVRLLNPNTGKPDTGRFAGVGTVVKKLQKNYLVSLNGGQVRVAPELLIAADEAEATGATVTAVPMPKFYATDQGKMVRVNWEGARKPAKWDYPADALFVILDAMSDNRVKIVKLGGDGGRYWRLGEAHLTLVTLAEIGL